MAMTLYQLVGVASGASSEEIKAAYVRKAALYRAPGAQNAAKLNALKQAYEVLSDPSMRARYDKAPYLVAEANAGDSATAAELLTPRNVLGLVVILVVVVVGAATYQRYQKSERIRLEQIEAKRIADEELRKQEELDRAEERRLAELKRQEQLDKRQLDNATYRQNSVSARQAAIDRANAAREQQLEERRQRDQQYREQADRRRVEAENRMQLEREKRLLREMQANHPRKF